MNEFQLKYGTNPNQKPARIYMADGSDLPVQILNGRPGYINFLDAFNSWQLVRDLKKALDQPAAASFKHVSPAGAAIGLPLDETLRAMYHIAPETELSPLACAYARARGADRMSSFGDWIALSDVCDLSTAKLIQHEVSDGIIAPGYDADALEVLRSKKKGGYAIVQIDADYEPKPLETRTVFGVTFEQGRQDLDRIPDQQDHPDRPGIRAPTCRSPYGRHPLLPAAPCELRIRSARSSMPLRHCRTTDRAYPAQSCSCRRCAAGMYVLR